MVVNGILPVDQLRDHVPPVGHVASVIPRHVLEDKYGIMLPPPREGEDQSRPPTAEEFLSAYACKYTLGNKPYPLISKIVKTFIIRYYYFYSTCNNTKPLPKFER
jgi:ribosome biogenesis GTPase A